MSGPPFLRFANSREIVAKAAKGADLTPDEIRALVEMGGWAKGSARIREELPGRIKATLELAYCHTSGLEARLRDLDGQLRWLGMNDPWVGAALNRVREIHAGVSKMARDAGAIAPLGFAMLPTNGSTPDPEREAERLAPRRRHRVE